jgi:hypothetical protein
MESLRLVGCVVRPRGGGGYKVWKTDTRCSANAWAFSVGLLAQVPCGVRSGREVSWRVSGTWWFSIRSSQWTQWGLGSVGRFGRKENFHMVF